MTENNQNYDGYSLHLLFPKTNSSSTDYDTVIGFYNTKESAVEEANRCSDRDTGKSIIRYTYYVAGFYYDNYQPIKIGSMLQYKNKTKLYSTK
jgi:hypothetical protein